jgi:hypothetical protein
MLTIELRDVKVVSSPSTPTLCFTASLYLDGQPAGTVSNTGDGGQHEFSSDVAESRLTAYAKVAPPLKLPYWGGDTQQPSVDGFIDEILSALAPETAA